MAMVTPMTPQSREPLQMEEGVDAFNGSNSACDDAMSPAPVDGGLRSDGEIPQIRSNRVDASMSAGRECSQPVSAIGHGDGPREESVASTIFGSVDASSIVIARDDASPPPSAVNSESVSRPCYYPATSNVPPWLSYSTSAGCASSGAANRLELSGARRTELLNRSRERLATVRREEQDTTAAIQEAREAVAVLELRLSDAVQVEADERFVAALPVAEREALAAMDVHALESEVRDLEAEVSTLAEADAAAHQELLTATAAEKLQLERAALRERERDERLTRQAAILERLRERDEYEPKIREALRELEAEFPGDTLRRIEEAMADVLEQTAHRRSLESVLAAEIDDALDALDTTLSAAADARLHSQREEAQRRSRAAFERRVAADRQAKADAELMTLTQVAADLEQQVELQKERLRATEIAEEFAILEELEKTYTFELDAIQSAIAATPTAAEVPLRRAALEAQVLRLAEELAQTNEDCALLREVADEAEAQSRFSDVMREVAAREESIKLLELETRRMDTSLAEIDAAIHLWWSEELPRHEQYHQRVLNEIEATELRVAQAALDRQRTQQEAVEQQRLQQFSSTAALVTQHVDPENDVDLSVAGDVAASSPRKAFEVVIPTVDTAGCLTTVVQQRSRPRLSHGTATAAPDPDLPASALPEADGERGPPASTTDGNNNTERHFNFIAVSVVKSVLKLFGWSAVAAPIASPRHTSFSV